ncbi:MAG: peptidoglycan-binding domain-containing protein [Polyangiales bacterium]
MSPWWIVAAGAGGAWWILRRKNKLEVVDTTSRVAPASFNISSSPPASPAAPVTSSPSSNSSVWLDHVKESSDMVSDLHTASQNGVDTSQLEAAMGQPLDTLTLQRDLNLLGATPALAEDGKKGPKTTQAIKDFQTHMSIPVTGNIDSATSSVLRLSVGSHVNSSTNA